MQTYLNLIKMSAVIVLFIILGPAVIFALKNKIVYSSSQKQIFFN